MVLKLKRFFRKEKFDLLKQLKWSEISDDAFEKAITAMIELLTRNQPNEEHILMIATKIKSDFPIKDDRRIELKRILLVERLLSALMKSSGSLTVEDNCSVFQSCLSSLTNVLHLLSFKLEYEAAYAMVAKNDVSPYAEILGSISKSAAAMKKDLGSMSDFELALIENDVRELELAFIENEARKLGAIVQGIIHFNAGRKLISAVGKNKSGGYSNHCLDSLQEAERLFRGNHDELHCHILAEIGLIFFKLNNLPRAAAYLDEALKMTPRVFLVATLESTARQTLAEIIGNKEFKEFMELEEALADVRDQIGFGIDHFVRHTLDRYPPDHVDSFVAGDWSNVNGMIDRKLLLKVIQMYHPDKINRTKFGEGYFLIREEIVKHLTEALNKLK